MTGHVALIGSRGYPSFYGGFETLLRHLVPFLTEGGWKVDVYNRRAAITPGHCPTPSERTSLATFNTPYIEKQSLSTLTHGASSTAHAAVRRSPDVALIMNVANGFWLPILAARKIPSVVNVDGLEWQRDKWGVNARRVFRAGAALTSRYADELVFDSRQIETYWERKFDRRGTFIAYGGDDPGALPPLPGLPRGSYVLVVARLVAENSIGEFLDAAEQIADRHTVVIVGSSGYGGPIEERVARFADRHENVKWFGHVRDDTVLSALWANAGTYFHGHSVGGTNPALVQAMACGAPTIARDTTYNREVLGESGVFVAPGRVAIAEAIVALMGDEDLRGKLSEMARKRQADAYTWSAVCGEYEALLASARQRRGHKRSPRPVSGNAGE